MSRMDLVSETFEVLLHKETATYAIDDYLRISGGRDHRPSSQNNLAGSAPFAADSDSEHSCGTMIDDDSFCQHEAKKRKLRVETSSSDTRDSLRCRLWRQKLCEWVFQVVDHFGLSRELVSIAMNCFDRHCAALVRRRQKDVTDVEEASFVPLSKDDVALTSMACLSLAIKLFEYKRILISGSTSTMETILLLGRGNYSMEDLKAQENDVLNSLKWMVHPPTPQLFLHYLFVEFGSQEHSVSNGEVRDLATYLIEMSVLDYAFISWKPSEIALAAILNAMDTMMKPSLSSSPIDSSFLGQLRTLRTQEIIACQQRLASLYGKAVEDDTNVTESMDGAARMKSPVSVTAEFLE